MWQWQLPAAFQHAVLLLCQVVHICCVPQCAAVGCPRTGQVFLLPSLPWDSPSNREWLCSASFTGWTQWVSMAVVKCQQVYVLCGLCSKVASTGTIKVLSPCAFFGHFEARRMECGLHCLPKIYLACHGFAFFSLLFSPHIPVIITLAELSVNLMFFWLNGPWLFSGHQLFLAGHQSQRNALWLHYYCLSRWHFWCNHCLLAS